MRWTVRSIAPVLAAVLTLAALTSAAPDEWSTVSEHWYELLIDNQKAGWMSVTVSDDGDRYRTSTETAITIGRGPEAVRITSKTRFIETHGGEPLEVIAERNMSARTVRTLWTFAEDHIAQTVRQGAQETARRLPRPEGTWLTPRAADRYAEQRRHAGAEQYTYRTIDPEHGAEPITIVSRRAGEDRLELGDRVIPVSTWTTTTDAVPIEATEHFSSDGRLVYQELPTGLGLMVTRIADRRQALAEAPGAAPELFGRTFVHPDRPIPRASDLRVAVLRLRCRNGPLPSIPTAGAQRVEVDPDGSGVVLRIDIDRPQPAADGDGTDPSYLQATAMVSADDPLVRKLADRAARRAGGDRRAAAEAMRSLVHRHISRKGLQTAFASAAETARTREGDCSEHAVLLAAMLRSQGIAARVASGLIYVDQFAGQRDCFGWHMWTQALIDGAWIDLDATLPTRYHAAHVLIGTSSLDDMQVNSDLASMLLLMGNLEIDVLEVGEEESTKHEEESTKHK